MSEKTKHVNFDVIIGNPPYQEETQNTSDNQIYPFFMDGSYDVSTKVELITPAKFLFDAGKTSKKWNKKMLADPHLKVLFFEQNSSKVFSNTDIKGGVCVTFHDKKRLLGPIDAFVPYKELQSILHKVTLNQLVEFKPIDPLIYVQNKFNLNALYKDYPELKQKIGSKGREKRLTTSIFSLPIFSEDQDKQHNIKIWGVYHNKRCFRYINEKYLDTNSNFNCYKVILPKANGSGALGEVISTPLIGTPLVGYTQSFISFGNFKKLDEAQNCMKYIKTKFARTMLGVLKVTQVNPASTWRKVPLQDFTSSSDIDWSKSVHEIDLQLYKKYNLTQKEIDFIEKHVKAMD